MGRSSYGRRSCEYCGKVVTSAGFARVAHMRMHAREGFVTERVVDRWYGRSHRIDRFFDETPSGRERRMERAGGARPAVTG